MWLGYKVHHKLSRSNPNLYSIIPSRMGITFFKSIAILCGTGKIFHEIFPYLYCMWRMFCGILSILQVIVMHMNNVMGGHLGPVYTTVEKASNRSRMLGQEMVI